MSLKVLRNTRSREFSRWSLSHCLSSRESAPASEKAKVHRAHVERSKFGLEMSGRGDPLADAHERATASGQVDDRARLLEAGKDPLESVEALVGPPRLGVAGVNVQNGGAGRSCALSFGHDLIWRHRQVARGRVDGARQGAGDNDFSPAGHCRSGSPDRALR